MNSLTHIPTPKGYTFNIEKPNRFYVKQGRYYDPGYIYIELFEKNSNKLVGRVSLEPYARKSFRTHSWLNRKYWNKGLGTRLYAKAIHWCHEQGYRVRSSGFSSDMAARVWSGRGLRKLFRITEKRTRSYSDRKTWYAYSRA